LGNEDKTFLRTAEDSFGRRAWPSTTQQEAIAEAEQMMNVYADFAQNFI